MCIQALYWWMAAHPLLSKTRAHARNVYLLYFFWLLGLLLQLLQRVCIDIAPIDSLKSWYICNSLMNVCVRMLKMLEFECCNSLLLILND